MAPYGQPLVDSDYPDIPVADVAEIQGLYGAFSFSEKLFQKLWLRRDFNGATARTTDGRRVDVLHPGRWNLLGGPDFRDARLRFDDGEEVFGDVELHLQAADWDAHGHAPDPAYSNVVLHVVLFEPEPGTVTVGRGGRMIPVLVLLPLLHHDLEEYAADEAVEALSHRPSARLMNELATLPSADVRSLLEMHAKKRWRQKVRYALLRVKRLGWQASCHHAALEVLGYRFNRAPMLRVAMRWVLETWRPGASTAEHAYESEADAWSLQGVRPANQPRSRLRQYEAWVSSNPDWPSHFGDILGQFPLAAASDTRRARRAGHYVQLRNRISREVCGGAVRGTRLDNLVCDALLPLLAAESPREHLEIVWFHWFCGDLPPFVPAGLRQLSICNGRDQPACHGLAQGLLGWLIEREVRR